MIGALEVPPEESAFLRILKLPEVKISAPLTSLSFVAIYYIELTLGFKSKCRVRCISSAQIGYNEIRDIKPRYYIGTHMKIPIPKWRKSKKLFFRESK